MITIIQAAEQDYEREKLNERIAKLSGGVAVIQVRFQFPFPKAMHETTVVMSYDFCFHQIFRLGHKLKQSLKKRN